MVEGLSARDFEEKFSIHYIIIRKGAHENIFGGELQTFHISNRWDTY